jgi:hypothetical protein
LLHMYQQGMKSTSWAEMESTLGRIGQTINNDIFKAEVRPATVKGTIFASLGKREASHETRRVERHLG